MVDSAQFESLTVTKLKSLVATLGFSDCYSQESFRTGAVLFDESRCFVYSAVQEISPLAVALTHHATNENMEIHLLVDQIDPGLWQQIFGFDLNFRLWIVNGKNLVEHPKPLPHRPVEIPQEAISQGKKFKKFDCDIIAEHGVLRAEVHGLEVARVVQNAENQFEISVGVGDYDQSAYKAIHGNIAVERNLTKVISTVKKYRTKAGPVHPLNRISRSRWLIAEAIADPSFLGIDELDFVEPLLPRNDVTKDQACSAIGRIENSIVLVLASTGIDLNLVPQAAGQIFRHNPEKLLLLLPAQDHHPAISRQARYLSVQPTFVTAREPWPKI